MLSETDILETLVVATKLLMHYEAMLACDAGIERPYHLDHAAVQECLRTVNALFDRSSRPMIENYGGFGFLDERMIKSILTQALEIIHQHSRPMA